MKWYAQKYALASVVLMATGCASFQSHKLPVIEEGEYKRQNTEKVKLFSRWKVESASFIVNQDAAAAVYKGEFEKTIRKSGCCEIVESPNEATLIIDGTALDRSNAGVLVPAVITGLSLYTIPSWVRETIDIKVNAKSGELTKTYQLIDTFTLVQWLPMIFAFPFTGGPGANSEELKANTYRNLIVQLEQDGYL